MDHVLSTYLFAEHRCTTALLDRIARAGLGAVELFCARQHVDWRNSSQIAELAAWFRDSELKLHSMHSPMYTDDVWGRSGPHAAIRITERVKARRVELVDEIKRVVEIAETIPCRYLIQHIGGTEDEEYDEWKLEAAFNSLDELRIFAKQRGVSILVENIPNGLSKPERLMEFLQTTHLDLGICFDVGHAHIGEGIEPVFELIKRRIRSTHVHDNDGKADQHLFPLLAEGGSIDWRRTMELLRSQPGQYPLVLELKEVEGMASPLDSVTEVFDRLENA
jgi:sugar phosphate isomerase/epimerase